MKAKPYSLEQVQEFEARTEDLSAPSRGVWIALRMKMSSRKEYVLERSTEELGLLLRVTSEVLLTALKEFELKKSCGYRVEKPPGYGEITDIVRLIYEPDEKTALLSSSESLRVSKYKESKKESERKRMPESWELTPKMKEFGIKHGMVTATITHEFTACKIRHLESLFTEAGWTHQVWQTWVMNWVRYGRKQVSAQPSNGQGTRPPPPPPKNDPIGRGLWGRQYGKPSDYGYE